MHERFCRRRRMRAATVFIFVCFNRYSWILRAAIRSGAYIRVSFGDWECVIYTLERFSFSTNSLLCESACAVFLFTKQIQFIWVSFSVRVVVVVFFLSFFVFQIFICSLFSAFCRFQRLRRRPLISQKTFQYFFCFGEQHKEKFLFCPKTKDELQHTRVCWRWRSTFCHLSSPQCRIFYLFNSDVSWRVRERHWFTEQPKTKTFEFQFRRRNRRENRWWCQWRDDRMKRLNAQTNTHTHTRPVSISIKSFFFLLSSYFFSVVVVVFFILFSNSKWVCCHSVYVFTHTCSRFTEQNDLKFEFETHFLSAFPIQLRSFAVHYFSLEFALLHAIPIWMENRKQFHTNGKHMRPHTYTAIFFVYTVDRVYVVVWAIWCCEWRDEIFFKFDLR